MTIGPDGIDVDYTGSPGVVALGLNVPLCYTEAYTSFGIKCIVAPKVPNNYASLATIRATAPEGCILNAKHPAPVAARSTIGHMLPDVMFGCLIQALPEGVPAEGTSCLWNLRLMGGAGASTSTAQMEKATPYNVMSFHSGGTGARPRADGLSATAFPSGCATCQSRSPRRRRRSGLVQGNTAWTGRRRRASRRLGPGDGDWQRRGHAVWHLAHLRPRRLSGARPARRPGGRRGRHRAGVGQDAAAQGAFLGARR
jgi:hypothetical protein